MWQSCKLAIVELLSDYKLRYLSAEVADVEEGLTLLAAEQYKPQLQDAM